MAVELRLTTVSWLPEVAIGAGILRFERERFVEREREREIFGKRLSEVYE